MQGNQWFTPIHLSSYASLVAVSGVLRLSIKQYECCSTVCLFICRHWLPPKDHMYREVKLDTMFTNTRSTWEWVMVSNKNTFFFWSLGLSVSSLPSTSFRQEFKILYRASISYMVTIQESKISDNRINKFREMGDSPKAVRLGLPIEVDSIWIFKKVTGHFHFPKCKGLHSLKLT